MRIDAGTRQAAAREHYGELKRLEQLDSRHARQQGDNYLSSLQQGAPKQVRKTLETVQSLTRRVDDPGTAVMMQKVTLRVLGGLIPGPIAARFWTESSKHLFKNGLIAAAESSMQKVDRARASLSERPQGDAARENGPFDLTTLNRAHDAICRGDIPEARRLIRDADAKDKVLKQERGNWTTVEESREGVLQSVTALFKLLNQTPDDLDPLSVQLPPAATPLTAAMKPLKSLRYLLPPCAWRGATDL